MKGAVTISMQMITTRIQGCANLSRMVYIVPFLLVSAQEADKMLLHFSGNFLFTFYQRISYDFFFHTKNHIVETTAVKVIQQIVHTNFRSYP